MKWIRSKLVVYVSLFLVSLFFGSFIASQNNNFLGGVNVYYYIY